MNQRISIDPHIQHGKPVIKGTRIPVTRIIGGIAGGMSFEEIKKEYAISDEDIRAAMDFVCDIIESEIQKKSQLKIMNKSLVIENILSQIKQLDYENRINLMEKLLRLLKRTPEKKLKNYVKLTDLNNLGSDIWKNINIDQYVQQERT